MSYFDSLEILLWRGYSHVIYPICKWKSLITKVEQNVFYDFNLNSSSRSKHYCEETFLVNCHFIGPKEILESSKQTLRCWKKSWKIALLNFKHVSFLRILNLSWPLYYYTEYYTTKLKNHQTSCRLNFEVFFTSSMSIKTSRANKIWHKKWQMNP